MADAMVRSAWRTRTIHRRFLPPLAGARAAVAAGTRPVPRAAPAAATGRRRCRAAGHATQDSPRPECRPLPPRWECCEIPPWPMPNRRFLVVLLVHGVGQIQQARLHVVLDLGRLLFSRRGLVSRGLPVAILLATPVAITIPASRPAAAGTATLGPPVRCSGHVDATLSKRLRQVRGLLLLGQFQLDVLPVEIGSARIISLRNLGVRWAALPGRLGGTALPLAATTAAALAAAVSGACLRLALWRPKSAASSTKAANSSAASAGSRAAGGTTRGAVGSRPRRLGLDDLDRLDDLDGLHRPGGHRLGRAGGRGAGGGGGGCGTTPREPANSSQLTAGRRGRGAASRRRRGRLATLGRSAADAG